MQKVQFKQYNEGEILLFPDRLDSTIVENHLVRVINQTVNQLDLTFLLSTYSGGGTTAYHPRMLLKVLLYVYCLKLYTGRKICKSDVMDILYSPEMHSKLQIGLEAGKVRNLDFLFLLWGLGYRYHTHQQ